MPFGGTTTIDDVESGQRAAARGGTTPRRLLHPGARHVFGDALADWKSKAEGKQLIDMGYHIAVTDLKDGGSLEELASLPDQGITSYKLFMAYKGALMVDDETLFKTMEVAAETGALVMVHAENGDAIDVLVKEALAEGRRAPLPRADAAARDRGRGDEPCDPAGPGRRLPSTSSTSRARRRSSRSSSPARRAGTSGARRARSTSSSTTRTRAAELRGREVRLHAAAARQGEPGRALERRAHGRAQRDLDRPLRLHLGRAEGARPDDFSKIPNGGPGLENRLHMIHHFGVRDGRIA